MWNITKEIILHLSDQLGILSIIGSGIGGASLATLLIEGSSFPSLESVLLVIGLGLIILDYFVVFPDQEEEI